MSNRVFGYVRVSTESQTTENQSKELAASGFEIATHRVICETISGSTPATSRPRFKELLTKLESGDVLVVTKLDRLGRNAMDVRATVELLGEMGVKVHCLALGGVDLTSPAGKMTMGVIAAVAEFELDLLKERTSSGLERAKSQGVRLGRPAKLDAAMIEAIKKGHLEGKTISELARMANVSRISIHRALER